MNNRIPVILVTALLSVQVRADAEWQFIDAQIATHHDQTGVLVLNRGEQALLTRAWLADHATKTIDIQYFIWSTDNIGVLASATLLRAADRGVKVRVIVDDLLIDAPDKALLALSKHPNFDIRIYNPRQSVGVTTAKRAANIATDFRGVNQRMHNKTFIVDGKIAITGGRNMADEYFDFNHEYNFRDRDALLTGLVVPQLTSSFEKFWDSPLTVPVESLYDGIGLLKKNVKVDAAEIQSVYQELRRYAADPNNFAPEIRDTIASIPAAFPQLAQDINWTQVDFVSDLPGKNESHFSLQGGGVSTAALAKLLNEAQRDVVIQSPYLVLSEPALALFKSLHSRGVRIRICTNSLASTDNLQAFSGYRNQRKKLLEMGIEIFEYRPDPAIEKQVMSRYTKLHREVPIFAIHAKTLVVDNQTVFIGTYNLDPRSENLNTEGGVIIRDTHVADEVRSAILTDMQPENSWNAAVDNPDKQAKLFKRSKVRFWQLLPIKPLL